MDVTIFTGPGCTSCEWAKAFLTEHHVSFVERRLTDDPNAMGELLALGARALPVIRVGGEMLSGFDPVKLSRLLGM